jgi:hypothetical protein
MVYPFARHVSERGHGHPDGFPVQLELKSERFGIAFRSLLACAFLRPESEQNSSHPPAYTAAKVERWIDCPVPRQTPITSSPHSACSTDQAGIPTDHSFTDLQIPATVMTANLAGRCPAPISAGPLWEALMAALAIPGLYPPWIRGEQRLVDAVSLTPVPLGSVVEAGDRHHNRGQPARP